MSSTKDYCIHGHDTRASGRNPKGECMECRRIRMRRCCAKTKRLIFDHYGRVCKCCGDNREWCLQIDHIENDGFKYKSGRNRLTGYGIYRFIINNGFPKNLQTLCANCNFGKRMNNGVCPHEIEKRATSSL